EVTISESPAEDARPSAESPSASQTPARDAEQHPAKDDAEVPTADANATDDPMPVQNSREEASDEERDGKDEGDENDDNAERDEDDRQEDYSNYSNRQLAAVLAGLTKEDNIKKIERVLKEVKPHYDELKDAEREEALQRFIAEG